MIAWNERVNLTAITEYEEVQTRHFLDSLYVSAALPPDLLSSQTSVLDIGSGAGFPGIPLKIVFPSMMIGLVEATSKKTKFLHHIVQTLGLSDVEIYNARAETLAHETKLRDSFDVVVSRAVANLSVVAELALPFCRIGGLVVTHKGPDSGNEIQQADKAIGLMGGKLKTSTHITTSNSETAGILVSLEKVCPTPNKYPRRPGIPFKRPI